MAATKATISKMKYDKTHMRQYLFKFNLEYDADVIAMLDSKESKQGYVRQLIREDIARTQIKTKEEEQTMKTYHIKPEYLELWEGGDTPSNPDRIITEDDIRTLSEEWEKPIEELLEQLIPID